MLQFAPSGSTSGHLLSLEFRRLAIKNVDGFDTGSKQGGRAMKEAHQVRNGVSVPVSQRHAVSLGRTVAHGGQKLERCQEGINADPLACQRLQTGLLRRCDILEVAAHRQN